MDCGARGPLPSQAGSRWWAMGSVYEAVGGDAGLLQLASAWHRRVMADEVVSHAFSHGYHHQHTERLAAYWAEALGGPTTFSDTYGDETTVVRMHSGNGAHEEMDRLGIECFDRGDGRRRHRRRPVLRRRAPRLLRLGNGDDHVRVPRVGRRRPAGLAIPRWSWDGLQS